MTTYPFNISNIDASWATCLQRGLACVDHQYIEKLSTSSNWLPGPDKIFNALSLPIEQVNYVLFGESPYPRVSSANGYAFWDQAVGDLWSPTGLSKQVNRATSLRNIIKMLLIAENYLSPTQTSQDDIAKLNKQHLVKTNQALFTNLLNHGFLLLNTSLVLQDGPPLKDAHAWQPFVKELITCLIEKRPQVKFILLGRIAQHVRDFIPEGTTTLLCAEHPYNLSFITNTNVLSFFRPLHLLIENKSIG